MKTRTSDLVTWSRARTTAAAPKNRVRRSQGAVLPGAGGSAASAVLIGSMIARRPGRGVQVRTGLTEVYAVAILDVKGVAPLERPDRWHLTCSLAAAGTARSSGTVSRPARRSWRTGPSSPTGARR